MNKIAIIALITALALALCACAGSKIEDGDICVSRPNEQIDSSEADNSSEQSDGSDAENSSTQDVFPETVSVGESSYANTSSENTHIAIAPPSEPIIATVDGDSYDLKTVVGDGFYIGFLNAVGDYYHVHKTIDGKEVDACGLLKFGENGMLFNEEFDWNETNTYTHSITTRIVSDSEIADIPEPQSDNGTDELYSCVVDIRRHYNDTVTVGSQNYTAKHYFLSFGRAPTHIEQNGEITTTQTLSWVREAFYIDIGDNKNIMIRMQYRTDTKSAYLDYNKWFHAMLSTLTLTR